MTTPLSATVLHVPALARLGSPKASSRHLAEQAQPSGVSQGVPRGYRRSCQRHQSHRGCPRSCDRTTLHPFFLVVETRYGATSVAEPSLKKLDRSIVQHSIRSSWSWRRGMGCRTLGTRCDTTSVAEPSFKKPRCRPAHRASSRRQNPPSTPRNWSIRAPCFVAEA